MTIREYEPLSRHTTLRTGGPARYFIAAQTEAEIREAIQFANERQLPVLVLGGGSNVLARDEGFDGVVIHIASRGIQRGASLHEVVAEAGEPWDDLVAWSVGQGMHGLENLSLIPGTVGAAVAGNIGAYGAEVKDTLLWAEALDSRTGTARRFAAGECGLAYRHSFFKTSEGRPYIITRAAFALGGPRALNTHYKDVRDYFAARGIAAPTLAEMREAVIAIRRRKLPEVEQTGTAGSFFKNPVIARAEYELLAERYPGLPGHKEGNDGMKIPLGWVLDRVCGLRGARKGRVGLHAEQALVLVNEGGSAGEVAAFAGEVAVIVKEKTGIAIDWEVERV